MMMIGQSVPPARLARPAHARRLRDGAAAALGLVATAIAVWMRRRRERALLLDVDDRLLRDIGLTPDARTREATKPFWRA